MIVGINHLKSFGIFKDFDGTSIKKFGRYNLVYGWNGTGKSTLKSVCLCRGTGCGAEICWRAVFASS